LRRTTTQQERGFISRQILRRRALHEPWFAQALSPQTVRGRLAGAQTLSTCAQLCALVRL
jgi:hypothetical protein